ncbi:MAG: dihydropteroate synthase [bacterium]
MTDERAGAAARVPVLIGERLNPSGNPRLAMRLAAGEWDALDDEARAQAAGGAEFLDVNGVLGGARERDILFEMIERAERVAALPLVLDSRDAALLAEASARTRAPAILSSIPATRGALRDVLPRVAGSGRAIVGLAMGDDGVRGSAEERFACAERFVAAGLALGVPRESLIVDCLAMPLPPRTAAQGASAIAPLGATVVANAAALGAMRLVAARLGAPLLLGISNAAYGAPNAAERSRRACEFLTAALAAGLDYAIANPLDERIRSILHAAKRDRGHVARPISPVTRKENAE